MILEYEMYYKDAEGERIANVYKFHVLITTFEVIISDSIDLKEINWRCCIIDEAHRLKNRVSVSFLKKISRMIKSYWNNGF